jgi:hypothetical protein
MKRQQQQGQFVSAVVGDAYIKVFVVVSYNSLTIEQLIATFIKFIKS